MCMCVYIRNASAYEIEERGTSGNTAREDVLRAKGFVGAALTTVRCTSKLGTRTVRLKIKTEGVCIS